MSDRELLELAAKGAAISGGWGEKVSIGPDEVDLTDLWFLDDEFGSLWNPLTDDGDAFRLAVKLDLSIITSWGFDGKPSGSVGAMLGSHEDLRLTSTKHNGDPCAAWRRTIVIAAAEIGKHTKC